MLLARVRRAVSIRRAKPESSGGDDAGTWKTPPKPSKPLLRSFPSSASSASFTSSPSLSPSSFAPPVPDLCPVIILQISRKVDELISMHHHQTCLCAELIQELVRCAVDDDGTDDTFCERYGGDFALSVSVVVVDYLERYLQSGVLPPATGDGAYYTTLLAVCYMVAMKLLDDNSLSNGKWSQATGIKITLGSTSQFVS
ncbi:hypothetical protein BASA81_004210 [Batrachochytrium salamandrivorans]|nr:hypothetical protein BASA81_004210 [Batrachochytrium salamandrivorans]